MIKTAVLSRIELPLVGLALFVPQLAHAAGKICEGNSQCHLWQLAWWVSFLAPPILGALAWRHQRLSWLGLGVSATGLALAVAIWRSPTYDVFFNLGPLLPLSLATTAAAGALCVLTLLRRGDR